MFFYITLLILLTIAFSLQFIIADAISTKWTDFRYLVFSALLFSLIFNLTQNNYLTLLSYSLVWLFTAISIPLIFKKARNSNILGNLVWKELTWSLAWLANILLVQIICTDILPIIWVKTLVTLLQMIILLYPLTMWGYYLSFGDCLDANSLIAIYQTEKEEAKAFLLHSIPHWIILTFLLFYILSFTTLHLLQKELVVLSLINHYRLIFVVLLLLTTWLIHTKIDKNYFQEIIYDSKQYLLEVNKFKEIRAKNDNNVSPLSIQSLDTDPNSCYVVIIGESQNISHMSAYGYPRETTPNFDKLKENSDFIFFNHAYSCHTLTVQVISQMLTEASQYNGLDFGEACSLLDIAKAAGYKTYWLSNHARYAAFNTPLSVLSSLADESYWASGDIEADINYDAKLLEFLPHIPTSGKRLIFLHLMGCHYEYKDRYPTSEKIFTTTEDLLNSEIKNKTKVNAYDNAAHYADKNIYQMILYACDTLNAKSIIFLSDHGEAVYKDLKHIPGLFVFEMARIPMCCYLSPKYKQQFPNKAQTLIDHTNAYFSNDMLYDTMLGIMGLNTEHYCSRQDLSHPDYGFTKETLKTLYGTINVADDSESN